MNELQIRLTAEIGQLLSTLKKAKKEIAQFEEDTNTLSEKGNVGYKRKLGIIEKLTIRAKELRTALSQATNENKISEYNIKLEDTSKQLARLNALGRSVTSNLGGTANGFNKLTGSIGNANGVSMEFNRIIQDAPFGLMGIGNNIQQLTQNFAQLKAGGASTGAVIKASLASMISPANLLVLGISAVTAAFTAYQMGAFDFVTATDEATTAQDEFNESLKDTEQTLKQGFYNELLKAQGLLKQENLGGRLVDVPAFKTANEVLEKLGSTIDGLNKNELEALSSFLEQRLADAARSSSNAATELEKTLANTDVGVYEKILGKVNEQLKFYETDTEKSTKATKDLQEVINSFSTDPLVDAYFEAIRKGAEFRKSLGAAAGGLTGKEGEDGSAITAIENAIALSLENMGLPVKEYADEAEKIKETNGVIIDSFASLGTAIAANLNISNNALKGFVSTVLSNAPKIIQSMIATAQANKAATAVNVASSKKGALANGIFMATETGKALGPIGLALLPVLIGGALALISGAFSGGGGGGGSSAGGGGFTSSAPPQIFTNKNTVQPPTPTGSPNFNSGDIDFTNAQSKLTVDVNGDYLQFILDRNKERKAGG